MSKFRTIAPYAVILLSVGGVIWFGIFVNYIEKTRNKIPADSRSETVENSMPRQWYTYSYPTGNCSPSDSPADMLHAYKAMQMLAWTEDTKDFFGNIIQVNVNHDNGKTPGLYMVNSYFTSLEVCQEFAKTKDREISKYR